ncbi:hypothetical protein M378DRAFT_383479 [Amanita muscaria Koide BX008]|uniref:Crinkler effector protein N-terminal domain-containing protein n=1 Tax=Amanita muscaria (strain Koide BX008) TaxID=946122 RepID=A0A0C2WMJ0_AMAMK|nr:hypothetical protein M378DRAFT_383479 [Amanita muscaria Koide BX008]
MSTSEGKAFNFGSFRKRLNLKGDKPTGNPTGTSASDINPSSSSQPLSARTTVPSQDSSRSLNCLIEGESIVFPVTLGRDRVVADLKKEIKKERALDTLKDAHLLELWNVDIDLETHDKHSRSNIRLGDVKELDSWKTILHYWPDQPPEDHLHIIVKVPVDDARESLLSSPTGKRKRDDPSC